MRSRFYIIPEHTYTKALMDLALTTPATAKMLHMALGQQKPQTFFCRICGRSIWWQDCPTGGWWVHDVDFPNSKHDAECGGYGDDEDGN